MYAFIARAEGAADWGWMGGFESVDAALAHMRAHKLSGVVYLTEWVETWYLPTTD